MRPFFWLVVLLVSAAGASAQVTARDRFLELKMLWEHASRDTSRDSLREAAKIIPRFAEVPYAADGETRAEAEKLLVSVASRPLDEVWYPIRAAALEALLAVARSPAVADRVVRLLSRPSAARDLTPLWSAKAIGGATGPAVVDRLLAVGVGHRRAPVRRAVLEGVSLLLDSACRDVAKKHTTALHEALADPEPRIRFHAVRALGHLRIADALLAIQRFVRDEDPLLRAAAAWTLGRLAEDPRAWIGLRALLRDPHDRVREEAAAALLSTKNLDACAVLIPRLEKEPKRTASMIYDGLRELTGLEIDDRASLWRDWWAGVRHLPRAELEARLRASREAAAADPSPSSRSRFGEGRTYYGIPVTSDRILFVLDISMSMRYGDPPRIETAKGELIRALGELEERDKFNVMVYSTGNGYLDSKRLVFGDSKHRDRAIHWVKGQSPAGGTDSWGALKAAFLKFPEVDTIFFLSDGRPSRGAETDPERIVARIAEMNVRRRVRVHTVALLEWDPKDSSFDLGGEADDAARFMRNLALATGGKTVRRD